MKKKLKKEFDKMAGEMLQGVHSGIYDVTTKLDMKKKKYTITFDVFGYEGEYHIIPF